MAASILELMVDPISRTFTRQAAEEIISVRVDADTQRRVDELADKCTEGTLSIEERAEYQEYVSYFNLLSVLQGRAQSFLDSVSGRE